MTRAYLRLDPGYDEKKESYPDGPYAALIATFCHGEMQPDRGRFRNERFLRAILGVRGKHVPYLIAHGDLIQLADGRLYIDGWDEWQEGDWKVTERVTRIRNRTRRSATGTLTPDVTVDVTPPVTAPRIGVSGSGALAASGAGAEQTPPPGWDEPEGEALTWLARHGCDIRPGNGYHRHLVTAVERFGVNAVIGKFDRLSDAGVHDGDLKGFIFGAIDALNPKPDLKALEREDRDDDRREDFARKVSRTKRDLAQVYHEGESA